MNGKKVMMTIGCLAMSLLLAGGVQTAEAKKDKAFVVSSAEAEGGYLYSSKDYGYRIVCPKKPHVIPVNLLMEGKKGEALIFDNDGYHIQNAWLVLTDAFDKKKTPDFNKMNGAEAKKYLEDIMQSNPYEGVMVVNLNQNNKAIYALTAKEVELDTDGDGKPDVTAKADTQMAVLFFRGNKGGCYSLQLIDNPELRESEIVKFQNGAMTFKEK
jgi:hypothetical protein